MSDIGGVGLGNMFVIFLFVLVMLVLSKVIFTQFQVPGLSELVQAA